MLWLATSGLLPCSVVAGTIGPQPWTVGSGIDCAYTSLQAAIDAAAAAPGAQGIRISRSRSYGNQALLINDAAELTLEGGYDFCADPTPDGKTTLNGASGPQQAVITHVGAGALSLRHLDIREGDAASTAGGVYSQGSAALTLDHVDFVINVGQRGGGLGVIGAPTEPKPVRFAGTVQFIGNQASLDGGGIHAVDAALITDLSAGPGARIALRENSAGRDGGGIHLWNAIWSAGFSALPSQAMFDSNTALGSGGAASIRATSTAAPRQAISGALLTGAQPGQPTTLRGNRARVSGGAVYLYAESDGTTASTGALAALVIDDAELRDNQAPDGAAIYAQSQAADDRSASAQVALRSSAAGLTACAASQQCGLRANAARTFPGGAAAPGDILTLIATGNNNSALHLHHLNADANEGRRLISARGGGGGVLIVDTLARRNRLSEELLRAQNGAFVVVHSSTFAGNDIGAPTTFFGEYSLEIVGSLVMQPSNHVLAMAREDNVALLQDVLVATDTQLSSPGGFRPQSMTRVFDVDDARFEDAAAGNYRLRPDSPAIDRWAGPPGTQPLSLFDLDARQRPWDVASMPNLNGAYDLGAYEHSPRVFADGFDLSEEE